MDGKPDASDSIAIPRDYGGLCEFIRENRGRILADWGMVSQILGALDSLLDKTENISDLHHDSRIILATVKLQQDALVREYQRNLTLRRLVEMAEKDMLDEFFELAKQRSTSVTFADQLSLAYTPRERRERVERARYDISLDPARTAGHMVPEDNGQVPPTQKIRNVVALHGEVEYFRLIIDPSSFSRTVHNAFNLSLAIREKEVSLISRNGRVCVAGYRPGSGEVDHSILHLTPAQLAKYTETLGIGDAML